MERNCDKCIHHTSGMCDSWECKMQTVEGMVKETRAKAIEKFAEAMKRKYPLTECGFGVINDTLHKNIDEIVNELKGE